MSSELGVGSRFVWGMPQFEFRLCVERETFGWQADVRIARQKTRLHIGQLCERPLTSTASALTLPLLASSLCASIKPLSSPANIDTLGTCIGIFDSIDISAAHTGIFGSIDILDTHIGISGSSVAGSIDISACIGNFGGTVALGGLSNTRGCTLDK